MARWVAGKRCGTIFYARTRQRIKVAVAATEFAVALAS